MGPFTWMLVIGAFAAMATVGASMARRPILARMAARNALRRPKQTATVIAGLLVGTAIISAALVAGDSAGSAIRGYVYQSLGHVDESVAIEGYPFFPESAYHHVRDDPALAGRFDAVAAHAIWDGAAENPRTGLFEPRAVMVGYEPGPDAGFGDFRLQGGGATDGRSLARGEAIVTKVLADELGAEPGDEVVVSFTQPFDPVLPEFTFVNGTLLADAGLPPLPVPEVPGYPPPGSPLPDPKPGPATHLVHVNRSASRLTAVVAWPASPADGLPPTTSMGLRLTAPDGAVFETPPAPPGEATSPVWLNVTTEPDKTLVAGEWRLEVRSNGAANVPYNGVAVVLYPVYDLALLRERAKALEQQLGGFQEAFDEFAGPSDRHEARFRVAAVTDGGRGDLFDLRNALFIRLDEAQELFGREGEVNVVKLSNPGGPREGARGSESRMEALNASLADLRARYPDVASVQSLEANALKVDFLAVADDTGQTLTGLLVFAGSLSIITGLLLIVNIFTMLAEERRSELGMARAVGLGRKDLVRLFVYEGGLYGAAASAIGALFGLGLAYAMIRVMNAVISKLSQDLSFPAIRFEPTWGALLAAFASGILLTFATIALASRRQASLNIVRAIRRIEEPDKSGSRRLARQAGIPLILAGLAAAALGWVPGALGTTLLADYRFSFQVFGPFLATLGLGILLRPRVKRHRLAPALAGALAAYYALTYFVITEYENVSEVNVVGPIRGVILTLCVVVLVTHFEAGPRALGRLLARGRRMRAIAIPAVSYPLHKKFRAGMTLAMFSVVILSVCFFSIFGALFQTDPERQTGGYDVEGRTTLDVDDLAPYDRGLVPPGLVQSVDRLADYSTEDPDFIQVEGERTGQYGDFLHHAYGFDEAFVANQEFRLLWRDAAYATDAEAYQAVLERDDAIVVSYQYSTDARNRDLAHEVGDTLELHLGEETLSYTIIGIQEQYHFPGVFLDRALVTSLFPDTASLYLYKLRPGADAGEAAKLLEQTYRDVGMDATASVEEVVREQESFRQVLGAMKLFLGLGLIVGVLSLGIVTSRSVLERRQEIGMLRALGFTGRQVRRIFFVEVSFTLVLGAVVGFLCAVLVTFGLWYAIIRDLNYPYVIPWGEIGVLLAVSYVVALLATWAPIGRSGTVPPAEALRYVE